MCETITPVVTSVKVRHGIAGQVAVDVTVHYGPDAHAVTFVGSTYGGPVVMIDSLTGPGGMFVTDPGRFGRFGDGPARWARAFFTQDY